MRLSIRQWSVDSAQWSQCLVSAYLSGARGAGREQARRRTGESIAKQAAVTSSSSAWNRSSREASCTAAHLRAGAYSREQAARRNDKSAARKRKAKRAKADRAAANRAAKRPLPDSNPLHSGQRKRHHAVSRAAHG